MSQKSYIYDKGTKTGRKRRPHKRRMHFTRRLTICGVILCFICGGIFAAERIRVSSEKHITEEKKADKNQQEEDAEVKHISVKNWEEQEDELKAEQIEPEREFKEAKAEQQETETRFEEEEKKLQKTGEEHKEIEGLENYPKDLQDMLEKYPQTYDFVAGYPQRGKYQGKDIDLSKEVSLGEVPLLLQWDKRWGYDKYGSKMIGVAGCGPTCMSMAYIYLTGDQEMNPRKMADFAYNNGYDAKAGTRWSFFTEGAGRLGLWGREIGLDEVKMKEELDKGRVIICSMGPGDFTQNGHFILIRGYDAKGFFVNDPNSKENSDKQWEFGTLFYQIKCLWSLGVR